MRNERGITLVELIVVIVIILFLLAILFPWGNRSHIIAQRVVCGTNLKGLGTAQTVYANDYEGAYTIQGGEGIPLWSTRTDGFSNPDKEWKEAKGITVGASLYLLVREADVSPKSFVCGGGGQTAYEGENPNKDLDITELWDFGMYTTGPVKDVDGGIGDIHGPRNHVSYSYQMPYGPDGGAGEFAARGDMSAAFAVMADKNPWYDRKLETGKTYSDDWADFVGPLGAYYSDRAVEKWEIQRANTYPHRREQNVLFGDGHSSFEKASDVGVKHDNIYTRRGGGESEDAIRIGNISEMGEYGVDNVWQPKDELDSFLVNDDSRGAPYSGR